MALKGRPLPAAVDEANGRNRRVFPLAANPDEGRFNQSTAANQPWLHELVFMPETVEKRVRWGGRRAVFSGMTVEVPVDRLTRAVCARRSGSDRRHQRSHTEDRDHSLQVIGQNVEAHLGSHLVEGAIQFGQQITRSRRTAGSGLHRNAARQRGLCRFLGAPRTAGIGRLC